MHVAVGAHWFHDLQLCWVLRLHTAVVFAVLCPAGTYDTAEEAALVYDAACRELRGPHTPISNFPDADEQTMAE